MGEPTLCKCHLRKCRFAQMSLNDSTKISANISKKLCNLGERSQFPEAFVNFK